MSQRKLALLSDQTLPLDLPFWAKVIHSDYVILDFDESFSPEKFKINEPIEIQQAGTSSKYVFLMPSFFQTVQEDLIVASTNSKISADHTSKILKILLSSAALAEENHPTTAELSFALVTAIAGIISPKTKIFLAADYHNFVKGEAESDADFYLRRIKETLEDVDTPWNSSFKAIENIGVQLPEEVKVTLVQKNDLSKSRSIIDELFEIGPVALAEKLEAEIK